MVITSTGPRMNSPLWEATKCFACEDFALWVGGELAFPAVPASELPDSYEPHVDMPDDAAQLFREAVAVLPYSKRAAAALCRASMERLVKHLDPDAPVKSRLDDRLMRLEGSVSSATSKALNVLRHVGNTALHGAKDDDESAVIYLGEGDKTIPATFFYAINLLVDELITRPARSDELYDSLPPGVRASYEEKMSRQGRGESPS